LGQWAPAETLNEQEYKFLDRTLRAQRGCWASQLGLLFQETLPEAANDLKSCVHFLISKLKCRLTGIPAGKNLSNERTGIMKQSCSSVESEIGSLREVTKAFVAEPFG
jgi:hypothetical protein